MINAELMIKISKLGLFLTECTKANGETLYSTRIKHIKVAVNRQLEVEVVDMRGDVPHVVDRGFYINPMNPAVAVERLRNKLNWIEQGVR